MNIHALTAAAMCPAVNSLASKLVPADEQGTAMGVVNSYNSLGRIFDPVVGSVIFDMLGIFFGLYPANGAARLKPIDALRYE